MEMQQSKYFCEYCNIKTTNKKDFDKHNTTSKHLKVVQNCNYYEKKQHYSYFCEICNKYYKDRSGLWRHKKYNHQISNETSSEITVKQSTFAEDKTLIIELLQQNKALQTSLLELSKERTVTHGNNNNNNNNNKTVNLQFFLNETCKNAMNISDFVSSIRPSIMDLEATGKLGYVEGISNIIIDNLKKMDTHDRPIHCNDAKREVIYIKDNDMWEKETPDRTILKNAIRAIAFENIKNINEWKKENPDCANAESKKNNTYLKIVSNSMAGISDAESCKNIDKIISNIAKEVLINPRKHT